MLFEPLSMKLSHALLTIIFAAFAHGDERAKLFKINKEPLRQLWYTATLRGLIKAKARACFEHVPLVEQIVYKECEKSSEETAHLAKCAVRLFDEKNKANERKREFNFRFNPYKTDQQFRPLYSRSRQFRAQPTGNMPKNDFLIKRRQPDEKKKIEFNLGSIEKNAASFGYQEYGKTNIRRFRREVAAEPLMPIGKKSLDFSNLAAKYFTNLIDKQEAYPHVENLEQIKDYLEKAKRIKEYYSLVNKENSKLFSKFSLPFDNKDPQLEKDEYDLLGHVLGIVNDFAATHLTSDSKFSILSPRLFSIVPEGKSETPRFLSPTIVSSNQGYQKMMLELILDISGAGQALEGVLTHVQPEMDEVNNVHYPLIQEMSRHDRNWLRAQRIFSENQKEAYEKHGFAYLNDEQMKLIYSNKRFTTGGINTTDISSLKSVQDREKELEEYIREIANSIQRTRFKRAGSHPKPGATINGVNYYTMQPMAFTSFIGEGSTLNAVTLSPQFFVTELLSTVSLVQVTLSPEAMVASILTPVALVARVLSPSALRADVLSPRAFHPWVLSPAALVTEVLVPKAFEPRVLSPEVLLIHVLSPNFISPSVGSGESFGLLILSPHFLSPRVASEEHFLVEVLSPHILGGAHGKHDETVISIGSHQKGHDNEHGEKQEGKEKNDDNPHHNTDKESSLSPLSLDSLRGMRRVSLLPIITLCFLFLQIGTVNTQYDYVEYIDPVEYDKKADCAIIFITIPVLVYMLLVSIFGHRMRFTAIRFHVINVSAYGLLHMLHMSAFSDRAPFPNWIKSNEWEEKRLEVDALNRSIFPAGLFFLYIEQMILVCAPRLEHNKIFNSIFAVFILILLNLDNLITYSSQYWEEEHWYNPVQLQSLAIHFWHFLMAPIYLIFCIFGSCCCCFSLGSKKSTKTPAIFVSMWLLVPYGMIPMIMEVPSFIGSMTLFATEKLMDWFKEIGLMKIIEEMMSGGGDGGSMPFGLTLDDMIVLMGWTFGSQPWFSVLFPLVNSILTIICFTPYREQFFFFLSCGKLYSEPVCWPWAEESKKAISMPSGLPAPVQVQTLSASVPVTGSMYPASDAATPKYPVMVYPTATIPVPQISHSSSSPNLAMAAAEP